MRGTIAQGRKSSYCCTAMRLFRIAVEWCSCPSCLKLRPFALDWRRSWSAIASPASSSAAAICAFRCRSTSRQRLEGRTIEALDRRAKYLLARLDDGEVLVMHLGMTGRFSIDPSAQRKDASHEPASFADAQRRIPKHEHIVFHLADGAAVRYSDARRFGLMDLIPGETLPGHALFKGLGVEPISAGLHARMAWPPAQGQGHIDQGRPPRSEADRGARQYLRLRGALPGRHLASAARRHARDQDRQADREDESARQRRQGGARRSDQGRRLDVARLCRRRRQARPLPRKFKVYGREGKPCPRKGCSGTIRRIVQSGRSTFYCPSCQR